MIHPGPGADEEAVRDERRRVSLLRTIVDLTTNVIAQGGLGRGEALDLVAAARRRILELFPDKEGTFELVLAPRFERLIREHCPPPPRVFPFPH